MANRDPQNRTLEPLPSENRTIFRLDAQNGHPYSLGHSQLLREFFATSEPDDHQDRVPKVAVNNGAMYVDFTNHECAAPYEMLDEETIQLWLGTGQLALRADIRASVVDARRAEGETPAQAFDLLVATDVTPEVVAKIDELNASPFAMETSLPLDEELLFLLHGDKS